MEQRVCVNEGSTESITERGGKKKPLNDPEWNLSVRSGANGMHKRPQKLSELHTITKSAIKMEESNKTIDGSAIQHLLPLSLSLSLATSSAKRGRLMTLYCV
jgi:hypothetical protein